MFFNFKFNKILSKECQIKGWNLSHKVLCSHSDMLLRLASLPRHKYVDDYQNFNRNFPSYKPPTSVPKTNNDSRVFKYEYIFIIVYNLRILIKI
jgi:hypothetical protein